MIGVMICCGATQLAVARALQTRLEQTAEARVRVEVCDEEQTVLELWDEGLAGQAIVLLLSADGVPAKVERVLWEPVLQHVTGHVEPALGVVVMEQCKYPPLLERSGFFRREGLTDEVVRDLQAWLIGLHPQQAEPLFTPAVLPIAAEDEPVLSELWRQMVDGAGEAAVADPQIAQKFARQASRHFREVFWVSCAGRATACLAGELGWAFGVKPEGTEAEAWRQVSEFVREHRVLVVLEEAPGSIPELASGQGRGCVVRTAAQAHEAPPAVVRQRRAEMLNEIFLEWRDTNRCRQFAGEVEQALAWALGEDWDLAVSLTKRAGNYFKLCDRRFEAAHFYSLLRDAALARGEEKAVQECDWELSWLRHEPGDVRAAWASEEQLSLFGDGGF
jgi:hypothetical protein